MKNNKGFSLIELMVGIAIIITTTTVVLSIIVSSFRISNKTTSTDVLRQNGNYAVSQMSRMIQFADSFGGVSTDGVNYSTVCLNGDSYSYLRIVYQGKIREFSCTDSINMKTELDDSKSLIDENLVIEDNSCHFTCRRDLDSGPVIGINFNLMSPGSGGTAEQTSKVNFSTRVKMRNN